MGNLGREGNVTVSEEQQIRAKGTDCRCTSISYFCGNLIKSTSFRVFRDFIIFFVFQSDIRFYRNTWRGFFETFTWIFFSHPYRAAAS